jgi:beclin 1-associated autophagy-related key regulator
MDEENDYYRPLRTDSGDEDDSIEDADEEECTLEFQVPETSRLLSVSMEESMETYLPAISHPFHFQEVSDYPAQDLLLIPRLQCSTCQCLRSNFFCFNCINRGEFISSRSDQVLKEKFCEKQLKILAMTEKRQNLMSSIASLLQPQVKRDLIQDKVNQMTRRISDLEKTLDKKKDRLCSLKATRIDRMNEVIAEAKRLNENNKKKLVTTRGHLRAMSNKRNEKRGNISQLEQYILEDTWQLSGKLRSTIFTLDVYDPDDHEGGNSVAESQPLLGYASLFSSPNQGHSKAKNQQKKSKKQIPDQEAKVMVVEPWILASPDYSAYTKWVTRFKESAGSSLESIEKRNDAFRISAALSYLAQMTEVLSGIVDVRLPRRMSFSEFYSKTVKNVEEFLTEKELAYKVAKLNTNIAYLCLSQRMEPTLINCRQPAQNLMTLLNPCGSVADLGRRGSIEYDIDFFNNIDKYLHRDLQLIKEDVDVDDSTDYDFDSELDFDDFEKIPNFTLEMGTEARASVYGLQQSTTQVGQSLLSPVGEFLGSMFGNWRT